MGVAMLVRTRGLLLSVFLLASLGIAKEKTKTVLPDFVLNAKTVRVLIDPDAGTPVNAPMVNKAAQEDVEKALTKWGRLSPVFTATDADLIITVRKGSTKIIQPTINGEPTNTRPVVVQPSDTGIHVGVNKGRPPDSAQTNPQTGPPSLGGEVGPAEDMFLVYDGRGGFLPESAPIWKYVAKNGLKSPDVPAVAEFRKAIDAALKQTKSKP
jgi:hypothetical protein